MVLCDFCDCIIFPTDKKKNNDYNECNECFIKNEHGCIEPYEHCFICSIENKCTCLLCIGDPRVVFFQLCSLPRVRLRYAGI